MKPFHEVLGPITEAIKRGKGRFALGSVDPKDPMASGNMVVLAVGSTNLVRVDGGFMIVLGMDWRHLEGLRDACTEALEHIDSKGGL